jgi:hypothetical protein
MTIECPNDKTPKSSAAAFRHFGFVINSSFVIRHLTFPCKVALQCCPLPDRLTSAIVPG